MADGRFELPGTTFMRKSTAPRTWHLGPGWAGVDRDIEARCGDRGPWLVFIASLPTSEALTGLCQDCLGKAGVEVSTDPVRAQEAAE